MSRKNGDGTFRVRPNGSVEYRVSYGTDMYGNPIRKSFYGKTETECRKKAKNFEKQLNTKDAVLVESTLGGWLDTWLTTYKTNVRASTQTDYKYYIAIIKGHQISKMSIKDIKPLHVTSFFNSMSEYSGTIIKKLRFTLNAAFETAIDNDLCYKNPVRRASIPHKKQAEKTAYDTEQINTIKDFALTDELFGLPMLILLNTGARSGELRALKYCDFNLSERYLYITRSVKRDGAIGPPKNGKSRYVPLTYEFTEILKGKFAEPLSKKYILGGGEEPVTAAGLRSRYKWFFDRLQKSLKESGKETIEEKSPHCIRHTYGTELQRQGMPIAIVSEILGHSSTDVTDKYTHLGNVTDLKHALDSLENTPTKNIKVAQ